MDPPTDLPAQTVCDQRKAEGVKRMREIIMCVIVGAVLGLFILQFAQLMDETFSGDDDDDEDKL